MSWSDDCEPMRSDHDRRLANPRRRGTLDGLVHALRVAQAARAVRLVGAERREALQVLESKSTKDSR